MREPHERTVLQKTAAAIGALLGVVAFAPLAAADPPKPPPEAFTACEGKASGDACSVNFRGADHAGTCDTPPGETRLACRPNRPPGPPPEAFTACEGKASGDTCSVSLHGADHAGTCSSPPGESRLACRPNDMHPPPEPKD